MATAQKYIDRAMRLNWWIDTNQYTPTQAIEDLNVVYHQIEDYITSKIWEWFFWDIWTALTTVIWQSEYSIPVISSGNYDWMPKVESVSIKYTANWDFIPAREVDRSTILQEYDLDYYQVNQSQWDPIFFVADNSIFIFPVPQEAVSEWIKFYWIKSLIDLTSTTTEANMFWWKIPTKYFYLLSDWMSQFIKRTQWKEADAEASKNIFENEILPKLIDRLWNRKIWVSIRWTPDLSSLKN